jgi:RNA polymerase sigma-54 factor
MKQSLQLKLSQHLALAPQLQQSIRLLQLSALEFNQEIEQILQDNPLLERDETATAPYTSVDAALPQIQEHTADETAAPDEAPAADEIDGGSVLIWGSDAPSGHRASDPDDDVNAGETQAAATNLREHLGNQLALTQIDERARAIVAFLIEALDSDGYLTQSLDELAELITDDTKADCEEMCAELIIGLRYLQQFDPPGIGARTPQECLDLQLQDLPDSVIRNLARRVVRDHLDRLATHDYAGIREALACSDDELHAVRALIKSLNPRPGAQYAPLDTRYVIPDVVVRKQQGSWKVSLNGETMPRLHVNRLYASILQKQRRSGSGVADTLATQLQEAKQMIKNIEHRFDTILHVAQAIVDRQRAFFDYGAAAMRPLMMREIADAMGMHESTISRVTTQKYMLSPRGLFELKYFFSGRIATDTGGAISPIAIRALIKQFIAVEDTHNPVSDAKIAETLGAQGIMVARRTIAKYRESLNIPSTSVRKTL